MVHLQQLKGMQSSKQDMWKRYDLSIESIRKGYLFRENSGTEPPRINICWAPPGLKTSFKPSIVYMFMKDVVLTIDFTNVRKTVMTWHIIPFSSRGKHVRAILISSMVIGFSIIPVSVCRSWPINPHPAWIVIGIPVQTNPYILRYFRRECLLFGLWCHHGKLRTHSFTGRFCSVPVRTPRRDFIAGTL